jgi:hypothetical protein
MVTSGKIGLSVFSGPDLIVHAILEKTRSIDDIKAELKGIMSRLVRLPPPYRTPADMY